MTLPPLLILIVASVAMFLLIDLVEARADQRRAKAPHTCTYAGEYRYIYLRGSGAYLSDTPGVWKNVKGEFVQSNVVSMLESLWESEMGAK